MDNRLSRFNGTRLERLTHADLPALARAIVAFQRKKCTVTAGVSREVAFVQLKGDGINSIVRADDWNKLVPYLTDGTLDPNLYPVMSFRELHREVQFDPAAADIRDWQFYTRVLKLLEKLFPTEFPTPPQPE